MQKAEKQKNRKLKISQTRESIKIQFSIYKWLRDKKKVQDKKINVESRETKQQKIKTITYKRVH